MKNMNKIQIILVLFLGFTFTSCETTDLEILNDPNEITVENGDLERYIAAIQVDFAKFAEEMGRNGARLTRIDQMSSISYFNAFDPTSTNFEWRLAYQRMFSDMKNAEILALEQGANKHIGVMKILKAYTLITLVDYFGDVPYTEANDLENFPNPNADDDAFVYDAALAMLDEGISYLALEGLNIETDFYYNNDFDQWRKLAKTLKMNAYVTTRLVDGDAMSKFNAIVNSGDYISSTADDFEFRYDTEILIVDESTNNDTRHPGYQADYTSGGATRYKSNYLMDQMYHDNDPRIRYYFFRQNECTPGNVDAEGTACPPNTVSLFCSSEPRPAHYLSYMSFCSVAAGYWGRDHGFQGGIPPDTFTRTALGVYPAAGNFDDDRYSSVGLDQGGQGAGITPIMLASWSQFMISEMKLVNNDVGGANTYLQQGMELSIAKAMSYGSLDSEADLAGFAPSAQDVSDYISGISTAFADGNESDRWEIFSLQQLKAHFGNGTDTYNMYRRIGYPITLQANIEASPGNFVRSFLYPADEANTNSNITQKSNVDTQVFWDNNPSSPGFPSSN